MSATWMQDDMNAERWKSIFYTEYTTVRTAVITPLVVVFIFLVLRFAGSRALTSATMFNKIATFALGSLIGGVPMRPNSPLVATIICVLVIVGAALIMDLAHTHGVVSTGAVHVKPVLIYANGQMLHKEMQRCMITPGSLASEVRQKGYGSYANIHSIVLEPAGSFSIISKEQAAAGVDLLKLVDGYQPHYFAPSGPQAEAEAQDEANRV